MMNKILTVIVLTALVWTVANAPSPEPHPRSVAMWTATGDVVPEARAVVAASALDIYQAPVPLVRSARPSAMTETSVAAAPSDADVRVRDDLAVKAAKSAIEADGYRGVTALSRSGDGSWRAKAYRGTTEVQLTVNAAGRVSAD